VIVASVLLFKYHYYELV